MFLDGPPAEKVAEYESHEKAEATVQPAQKERALTEKGEISQENPIGYEGREDGCFFLSAERGHGITWNIVDDPL